MLVFDFAYNTSKPLKASNNDFMTVICEIIYDFWKGIKMFTISSKLMKIKSKIKNPG